MKPIIFLNSDYYSTRFRIEIKMFARYLNSKMINISNESNFQNVKIDKLSYEKYINKHIIEDRFNNDSLWDIFLKDLNI